MENRRKQATTLTKKFQDAKCEDCIHFWIFKTGFATCTNPKNPRKGKRMKQENFIPCINFED